MFERISRDGTNLFILFGDSANYWAMDTSESFTETNVQSATFGIYWDSKVFKSDSTGVLSELTNPATSTPSVTGKGSLPIPDNSLQTLFKYFDADGNDIIYAATNDGLWAHDYANSKWLQTALKTPNHATGGKGAIVWQDSAYISAGQQIHKYIAGTTASITKSGLDQDDGLPVSRNGEIVYLVEGYNEFYALLDSTYEGTTSRSQVLGWDGRGWQVWWEATADNKNMYTGLVSSVGSHNLWFTTTDGFYKIPLQKGTHNPKKVSGYTFAGSGYHMTPWFDAGTKAFQKLAVRLNVFTSDCTADEKITVYYRIDKGDTTLDLDFTNWTKLTNTTYSDGITGDGQTQFTFGNAGVLFYDIQFYLVFGRQTDTTESPNLHGIAFSYDKMPDNKNAWDFTITTANQGRDTAKKLYDNLQTALDLKTLIPFTYRAGDDSTKTYYVEMVTPFYGFTPTGRNWEGEFHVELVEP